MQKAGESYTTARAHLLQKHQVHPTEYAQSAVQHRKLGDRAVATRMKAYWADRLGALGEVLGASA